MTVFFIADIVGEPGLEFIETMLPDLLQKHSPDFVIANGENSHEGRGINESIVKRLYDSGVHVITGGNHSFDKWKIFGYMNKDRNLLRPLNYPKNNPGFGYGIYEVGTDGLKVAVLNLQGRTFMPQIDDPFSTADWALDAIRKETDMIIVDFHAEATAEKRAMGWHLDGRVSAVIGTHTHIPTNDAQILPQGTGYITDAGMTGPFQSVIGMNKKTAMNRFILGIPQKFVVAKTENRLCGVLVTINTETARCSAIEPIIYPEFKTTTE
ncbi:MAG: TIGR00282 family metallophosphoesterase [Balneolaceae bacterium]